MGAGRLRNRLDSASHQDRGADTPAFRPGRKHRFTSPEMSVVFASVFVCPVPAAPHPAQEAVLRDHCAHARYVWNLAVEQHAALASGPRKRAGLPGAVQAAHRRPRRYPWLAAGSQMVQQQALRDFTQAMAAFFDRTTRRAAVVAQGRPGRGVPDRGGAGRQWTCAACTEGRPGLGPEGRVGAVPLVPCGAAGREVLPGDPGPGGTLACRVRGDSRSGPRSGQRGGRRRRPRRGGAAALSTGELLHVPGLSAAGTEAAAAPGTQARPRPARLAPPRAGEARIARLKARETDRRKDWAEKTSTGLARRFDVIRVENLDITGMTRSARGTAGKPGRNVRQKAGLNRGILRPGGACWSAAWRRRPPAGSRSTSRGTPASAARRAGTWMRGRARAKRALCARPAVSPATRM